MNYKVCFIGAGNLATHLSVALQNSGMNIVQVYSRTEASAKQLASRLNTDYTISSDEIEADVDIYFIAIKDAAFQEVLATINFKNKLVVHCSGSLPLSVLSDYSNNIGVLYPLQTFTKNREVMFHNIPLFVEANSKENENLLLSVARRISGSVQLIGSDERRSLHISAVFACNFVNHLYTIAADYLNSKSISFEVLRPLVLETALKVQEMEPDKAQTGPAVRFDKNIISSHLKELEAVSNYAELYNWISKSIFDRHKKQ